MTKQQLLEVIDPIQFYRKYFPKWDGHANVTCPFHTDKTPSLNINAKTGQAYCHSAACPEKKFANAVHFYERKHRVTERQALDRLAALYGGEAVDAEASGVRIQPQQIAYWHEKLINNFSVQDSLLNLRGLGRDTIEKHCLGFDPTTKCITLPIFNAKGKLVNVRSYNLIRTGTQGNRPKMVGLRGCSCKELYPIKHTLKGDEILLFGGEMDALLARQAGFNAVSSIAGEGCWQDSWLPHFVGRKVWLCLDQDAVGRAAATKIKAKLLEEKVDVTRVILPFSRPNIHKDFTDWVVREHHDPQTLREYLKTNQAVSSDDDHETVTAVALSEVMQANKFNKKYELHCLVSGKHENPFIVPSHFKLTCSGKNSACPICMADDSTLEYNIPPHQREILGFANLSDEQIRRTVLRAVGAPAYKCFPQMEIIKHTNLHEIWVIPDTAYVDSAYTMQKAYYTGESIEANTPYIMEARLVSEPQSQKSALLVSKALPTQSSVECFKLGDKEIKQLQALAPKEDTLEGVWDKLVDIAEDHSRSRTHILDRVDLHMAVMLTYHSALQFYFDEENLERGWMNTLVVGDTASGKSEVVKHLRNVYCVGEFATAENCTFMGLVGGLMSTGKQWIVRWGKIPLNDRRLVALEELSSLSVPDIGKMTDVRSSGIARIDKGGHSTQTTARTRLIFLSNPRREGKTLHDYPSGVAAVADLIGNAEDVRRFDIIITTRNAEVSMEKINAPHARRTTPKYSDDLHKTSVAWAWSLRAESVVFDKRAIECCLGWALKMSNMYHSSIPVFKGEDGRYKIARVAAAIAAQVFSFHSGKLVVKSCHIEAAVRFLILTYKKASMGYDVHSRLAKHREVLGSDDLIAAEFAKIDHKYLRRTIEMMVGGLYFTDAEFEAMTGLDEFDSNAVIKSLYRERGLQKDKLGWTVTPALRDWLEKQRTKKKGK